MSKTSEALDALAASVITTFALPAMRQWGTSESDSKFVWLPLQTCLYSAASAVVQSQLHKLNPVQRIICVIFTCDK